MKLYIFFCWFPFSVSCTRTRKTVST